MSSSPNFPDHPSDAATARRLRALRGRRIDTSTLDARVGPFVLPAETDSDERRRLWIFAPQYRAIAASVALLLTLAAILTALTFTAQPARASEEHLAAIYQSAVALGGASVPVQSVEEARAALHRKWADAPTITAAEESSLHVMSCCVHEVGRKQMASITFLADGQPVTAAVARSEDIRSPKGRALSIGDRQYVVGSANGINMVMQERDGIWTCVMGPLTIGRLAELLESLKREQ